MNIEYGFQSKDGKSRFMLVGNELQLWTGSGETLQEDTLRLPGWVKQFIMETVNEKQTFEDAVDDLLELVLEDRYCIRSHKGDELLAKLSKYYGWDLQL